MRPSPTTSQARPRVCGSTPERSPAGEALGERIAAEQPGQARRAAAEEHSDPGQFAREVDDRITAAEAPALGAVPGRPQKSGGAGVELETFAPRADLDRLRLPPYRSSEPVGL